jgi:D-alanyl-D-alanine carboxypeptidase
MKSLDDISTQTTTGWWTAGAVISNLYDLKKWVKALARGTLVSPAMHQEQVKFAPPNTIEYGLGVRNGNIVLGHSGEVPGYNSCAYTQPGGNGYTVIVLLNRYPFAEEGVSDQILSAILQVLGLLPKK